MPYDERKLGNKPAINHVNISGARERGARGGILINSKTIIEALHLIIDQHCADASEKEKEIMRDNLEIAVLESASDRSLRSIVVVEDENIRPPVPELAIDDIEKILAVGRLHAWKDRGDDKRNPVQWVIDHYKDWIPGLLQNHIGQADPQLYNAYAKYISRKGLPSDLDIPTSKENRMRATAPDDRTKLNVGRQWHAARMRASRARRAEI